MKRLTCLIAFIVLGILMGVSGPSASADTNHQDVTSLKDSNFYTRIKSTPKHNYGVYKSGGWKTSAENIQPIAHANEFRHQKVHITQQENAGNATWLKFTYHQFTGWVHENATDNSYRWLNVPLIAQRPELPTGCEIVATTMMLNFAGSKVTKMQLAKQVPRSRNPNKGFVGSPYSPTGWYVYPRGLMKVVKRQVGSAKNMTGATTAAIKQQITNQRPVVVWLNNVDGFVNHAITISGFSKTRFYYNDPWTKKKTSMKISTMQYHRSRDGYRALSY